jgi:hypothetical protein
MLWIKQRNQTMLDPEHLGDFVQRIVAMFSIPHETIDADHLRWSSWMRWIAVTVLGIVATFTAGSVIALPLAMLKVSNPLSEVVGRCLTGLSLGIIVGGLQWRGMLRHLRIPAWWIWLGALGGVVGGLLGTVAERRIPVVLPGVDGFFAIEITAVVLTLFQLLGTRHASWKMRTLIIVSGFVQCLVFAAVTFFLLDV